MIEVIFFTFFSMMAVAAALSVILQRNPVYSALSLIIVIASMGGSFFAFKCGIFSCSSNHHIRRRDHGSIPFCNYDGGDT